MKLVFPLLLLLFLINSCKDDDNTAPPITEENTFSCRIDGQLFVPENHGGFPVLQRGILVSISENNWDFAFGNTSTDILIYIVDVTATGTYSLALSDGDAFFTQEFENLMEADLEQVNGATHVSTSSSGVIEVLELEVNKRIVLQFDEIVLVGRDNPNDTITLTEGKLNINLDTLSEED